jgi:multiple sugar transport system substrate-binding protein
MRRLFLLAALLLLAACQGRDERTEIVVQRFFGECGAVYGSNLDLAKADGECGIVTTLINKFRVENPDVRLRINIVAWPGYPQLSAQVAAGDPPDLVTMHQSVISDYQARGLLEPMDGVLAQAGYPPASFTEAGRAGVMKNGRAYGLPFDTIGGLFHINTALMSQAGLMRNGRPILPRSPEELIAHARRFRARTGKPYLVQSQVNDPAGHVRNLYTYLLAQDVPIFPGPRTARLNTPEARAIVALFRQLNREGLSTTDQDFPAATAAFLNGQGGIFPVGTWMIGPYTQEASTPGRPIYRSYAVLPYPALWGRPTAFVDGHAWVMPKRERSPAQRAAIARFLRFLAAHDLDWSRTGHLPAIQAVLAQTAFAALPHRADIAAMASTGRQLPDYVQRQSAIQGLIGEELEAAISGSKPIDRALADAERRVNELFRQMLPAGNS